MCAVESINYHLELTPAQLKITHTALRSLRDDFGHDERQIHAIIHEVLAKLPDEHAIRAIQLDTDARAAEPRPGATRPAARPSAEPESLGPDRPAARARDRVRVGARLPLQAARAGSDAAIKAMSGELGEASAAASCSVRWRR